MILPPRHDKGFLVLCCIVTCLFLGGCKGKWQSDEAPGSPSDVVIIISSDTTLTTRVKANRCYLNYDLHEVATNNMHDTLVLQVREFDLIQVLNPSVELDSVVVKAGDTLFLDIFREGYTKRQKRAGQYLEAPETANSFLQDNANTPVLDSLQQLFFYVDYNWPFTFKFEHSRSTEYPIIPVTENIQNNPKALEFYVDLMIKDFQHRYFNKSEEIPLALHQLHAENRLSKMIFYLGFLHRKKPYDFLRETILSDMFLNFREPEKVNLNLINSQVLLIQHLGGESIGGQQILLQVYDNPETYWRDDFWVEYARYYILTRLAASEVDEKILHEKIDHYTQTHSSSRFVEPLNVMQQARQKQTAFLIQPNDSLVQPSGAKKSFHDLLKELKGKKVLIDFWASWCAPCIKSMPAMVELIKADSEDIAFVFVSIDENQNAWMTAQKKHLPEGHAYSFIAPGFPTSDLQKEFNVNGIPHYVLLGEKGELIFSQVGISAVEIAEKLKNL